MYITNCLIYQFGTGRDTQKALACRTCLPKAMGTYVSESNGVGQLLNFKLKKKPTPSSYSYYCDTCIAY